MAKPKLSDVAALAGVSPTTVSRVLNNRGYLSENTRTKVHDAMRELGYRPNAIARSLQGQRSQMVGLIFPTVANPFYGEMVYRLESYLAETLRYFLAGKHYRSPIDFSLDNMESVTLYNGQK